MPAKCAVVARCGQPTPVHSRPRRLDTARQARPGFYLGSGRGARRKHAQLTHPPGYLQPWADPVRTAATKMKTKAAVPAAMGAAAIVPF